MKWNAAYPTLCCIFTFVIIVECCRYSREYYSSDLGICVACPVNCGDQVAADVRACREACEPKLTSTHEESTVNAEVTTGPPTETLNATRSTTLALNATPSPYENKTHEKGESPLTTLAISVGTIIGVIIIVVVGYLCWRSSRGGAGNEQNKCDEEQRIELCGESSSGSSQEPSPALAKRPNSEQDVVLVLPVPETTSSAAGNLIQAETEENYRMSNKKEHVLLI